MAFFFVSIFSVLLVSVFSISTGWPLFCVLSTETKFVCVCFF